MIRTMLKPFLKKYIGLFISMVFVSMLSIGLLTSFASTIYNLRTTFKNYLADYGDVDAVVSTKFTQRANLEDITNVDGVETVEYRLSMDTFMKKESGRTITARVFTFKDDGTSLFNRYILESTEKSTDKVNVSVVRKFAENNGFKLGDVIKLGYFDIYIDLYVNEIIETPEAIQSRANNYVWSDNTDFGYVYVSENELNKALNNLAESIENKIVSNPSFKTVYDKVVSSVGVTFPDVVNELAARGNYATAFTNQILVKAKKGYPQEVVTYNVKEYLEGKDITVKDATENHNMFYYLYIENALRQLQVAAIFLPLFFYSVTMIVIGLFVNQIIRSMTPQIGIMMSIGAGKKDIISIFLVFSLLMSIVAGILGSIVGVVLTNMLSSVMIKVYSIPTLPLAAHAGIAALAIVALIAFALLATLISCKRIFSITPKDATISNEAARKKLPPKLERVIERSPMNIKLALNSIAQNPRRFFVSVFSIFASFVMILLALFFNVAKGEMIDQTVNRRLSFDAQVYMTSVADEETISSIKAQPCVSQMIDCYYTYAEATTLDGSKHTYLECLGYDETAQNDLIIIPDKKGRGSIKIEAEGLILPSTAADALGVKAGDVILVNKTPIKVSAISFQYFHPMTYTSKTQMEKLGLKYISSLLVNVTDEDAFLTYMSENNAALTVFTESLAKDIYGIFDSINVFIYIMIGFAFFMGFIILTIMGQNALMEQRRPISILRAIGFRLNDISNLWILQSVSQLILSSLFAIPAGALVSMLLFALCSSAAQTYPFVFSIPVVLIAFAFIFVIIVASHLISVLTIKKWNLADNTRTRE